MAENEKPKTARNFRNYKVWQDAVAYATEIYKVTNEMPWFEKKGLCDQLQRAAIANNVGYINNELFNKLLTALFEIEKQLNGLIHSVRSKES